MEWHALILLVWDVRMVMSRCCRTTPSAVGPCIVLLCCAYGRAIRGSRIEGKNPYDAHEAGRSASKPCQSALEMRTIKHPPRGSKRVSRLMDGRTWHERPVTLSRSDDWSDRNRQAATDSGRRGVIFRGREALDRTSKSRRRVCYIVDPGTHGSGIESRISVGSGGELQGTFVAPVGWSRTRPLGPMVHSILAGTNPGGIGCDVQLKSGP
ncbi:hypothetical protein F5Y15DRAFT_36103 [Xylariaceae sp. FL0016]|nr:hypothetical protein F5Y15DRAFT_36103 [Xylariaceae sp. FL0016]